MAQLYILRCPVDRFVENRAWVDVLICAVFKDLYNRSFVGQSFFDSSPKKAKNWCVVLKPGQLDASHPKYFILNILNLIFDLLKIKNIAASSDTTEMGNSTYSTKTHRLQYKY